MNSFSFLNLGYHHVPHLPTHLVLLSKEHSFEIKLNEEMQGLFQQFF